LKHHCSSCWKHFYYLCPFWHFCHQSGDTLATGQPDVPPGGRESLDASGGHLATAPQHWPEPPPIRRKESVARMTFGGLAYVVAVSRNARDIMGKGSRSLHCPQPLHFTSLAVSGFNPTSPQACHLSTVRTQLPITHCGTQFWPLLPHCRWWRKWCTLMACVSEGQAKIWAMKRSKSVMTCNHILLSSLYEMSPPTFKQCD
jgi:hypothetical protein